VALIGGVVFALLEYTRWRAQKNAQPAN